MSMLSMAPHTKIAIGESICVPELKVIILFVQGQEKNIVESLKTFSSHGRLLSVTNTSSNSVVVHVCWTCELAPVV